MRWYEVYASRETCSQAGEQALILGPASSPWKLSMFTAARDVYLGYVGEDLLEMVADSSLLIDALRAISALDAIVSDAVGSPRLAVYVHGGIYGPDEVAHVYEVRPSFVSFNLASSHTRRIVWGAAMGVAESRSALCDLYLHEKAHQLVSDAEHTRAFYSVKLRLKTRLLAALVDGAADPFVEGERTSSYLVTVADVLDAHPELARTGLHEHAGEREVWGRGARERDGWAA